MYATQYEITLPADYDMKIIRRRVADKGPLLDALPGLGLKAYLIRERDVDGSPVNQYAPFYLWTDLAAAGRFLWGGGGFGGIVADFGRPAVRTWTGVAALPGPSRGGTPAAAVRHTRFLHPHSDPAGEVDRALADLRRRAAGPGVHTAALAVDPASWELVEFTLYERPDPAAAGIRYEVLHLSRPHLDELPPV